MNAAAANTASRILAAVLGAAMLLTIAQVSDTASASHSPSHSIVSADGTPAPTVNDPTATQGWE